MAEVLVVDDEQAICWGLTRMATQMGHHVNAAASAELAGRFHDAGNISDLELQVQRAEATQARIALHDAQLGLADARATLQKLLGISALRSAWAVPESLPDMPPSALPMADELAARAIEQRLDIASARGHVQHSPQASVTPVPAPAQPAPPAAPPPALGTDSFNAERLARAQSCSTAPLASLVAKGPGFENYSVPCDNGDALAIRCEFGNCRVLQ